MKIGIEGQRLYRKNKHGMDMVALQLIKNLQRIDKKNEYVIFIKPNTDSSCIPIASNFKIVELKSHCYPYWEQIALPKAAKKRGCDLLHCTSNTGPIKSEMPIITTLHDIIFLEHISIFRKAGTWYQKFGNMYRRFVVPPVIKKSKQIITVSNFEKNRIKKFMGLTDKVVTIYNGVGEHFKKITDEEILKAARIKYKLPDDFIFFLGNTDPKKNTPNVLTAFAKFNAESKIKYKLVMPDYEENSLQKVLSKIGHPEIRKNIHLTGYVLNPDLPAIINQCKVFLYPSLRESFGIPILEGMACGVPVITSNTSSMPEIAGDAGFLVNPEKPEEIKNAIETILNDKQLQIELSIKGIERSKLFSWEGVAQKYLDLYQEVFSKIKNNN